MLIVDNIIKPYSAVLFLDNKYAAILVIAVTFLNPNVAISGIFAIIFTLLFAKLISMKDEYLSQGFYLYNSLLVGMGIGFLFHLSLITILLIAILSIFTFIFSFMLNRLFSVYKIPILSLPFSIVTIFIYLASLKYSNLLTSLIDKNSFFDIELPILLSGFFKSFGTIFFLPSNISGILLFLIVLYFSRIIALLSLGGFYFGVLFHSILIGSYEQALIDIYAFNYILTSIAIGSIFLLPTAKNFLLSLIAVAISVILTDAISILFNYYNIPVFTLPFNFTVISFIFILSIIYYDEFNYNIKSTPEQSLSFYLSQIFRFGKINTKISLPFSGSWSVYQGFDDIWTHKGEYKYAYDFVISKDGKSYENDGNFCTDYYCFGQSILSPISGYIVDLRDDLIDNNISEVDRINNWGNYIIIKGDDGIFVQISHIMQHSIIPKVGDYITVRTPIAKCGNSGYSPLPHIHIQVQFIGVVGGFTREFCFKEYFYEDRLIFNSNPKTGDIISSVMVDRSISSRLSLVLDDSFSYDVYIDDTYFKKVTFTVQMDNKSEFYLQDEDDNRLYFYSSDIEFYFYNYEGDKDTYLAYIFILAPKFPFINKEAKFVDYLPIYLLKNRFEMVAIEMLSTINKNYYKAKYQYRYQNNKIISDNGYVELSKFEKWFQTIKYRNITLQKCKG